MTPLRPADLPPAIRRTLPDSPAPAKPRSTAKDRGRWRCATVGCGHESGVWAEVERHSHGLGHARVEQVIS